MALLYSEYHLARTLNSAALRNVYAILKTGKELTFGDVGTLAFGKKKSGSVIVATILHFDLATRHTCKLGRTSYTIKSENVAPLLHVLEGRKFLCAHCGNQYERHLMRTHKKFDCCPTCLDDMMQNHCNNEAETDQESTLKKRKLDDSCFAGLATENLDIPVRNHFSWVAR
jgi:hypothetical protein